MKKWNIIQKMFCGILQDIYIISVTAIRLSRSKSKKARISKLYEIQNLVLE